MALFTASIASGSNGNCYFVGNENEGVFVDAGISCREIEKRMMRLGLSMKLIKAIFITHEHTDHIRGLATLIKKYDIPVFMTLGTWEAMRNSLPTESVFRLIPDHFVQVGALRVLPFLKHHDAAEPISVVVSAGDVKVGVFTDIGHVCEQLVHHFSSCEVAYLECNYDVDLLVNGRYPYFLKNRIRGGKGHLSNVEALELLANHRHPNLKLIFPSHLSRDNNSPAIIEQLFHKYLSSQDSDIQLVLAGRDAETPLYCLKTYKKIIHEEQFDFFGLRLFL